MGAGHVKVNVRNNDYAYIMTDSAAEKQHTDIGAQVNCETSTTRDMWEVAAMHMYHQKVQRVDQKGGDRPAVETEW